MGDIRVGLENVYVTYRDPERPALSNINLRVKGQGIVLITGPNGSGKTTLLECCLGLLRPFMGVAKLMGIPTTSSRVREARKLCSYLPQRFMRPPYDPYTVRQVIALGLTSLKGFGGQLTVRERDRIERVSKLLGIEDLLDRPIGTLSGGQQQRVFLARALAREPLLLFLDEPFSSIDPSGRKAIIEVLCEYVESKSATAFIVSHALDASIDKLASLTVALANGRIVELKGDC